MGGVWRTVKRRKQTCVGALRSKRGSCSSGGVWRTTKRDSTRYCSSPPSTSSILDGQPSTSSSLHGLLFIQPPPRATPPATVQPALSTGSCSTTPPPSTVHPALHRLLFIQPSTPRGPVHPEATPPLTVHPNPPATLSVHPINWLQLAAVVKESLDWVQLTTIDRSFGFSNA